MPNRPRYRRLLVCVYYVGTFSFASNIVAHFSLKIGSVAQVERRFYNDHDRKVNGSTPNLVSLLRPWIRCFTMIISAWWNPACSKLKKSVSKI